MLPREQVLALTRDLARTPAGVEVTCAGPSMEPAIRRGDRVRVKVSALRPGDVFVFETGRAELEMHRLVLALPGGWLVHRGDNQQRAGFDVTRTERVIGRAEVSPAPPRWIVRACALATVAWRAPRALWRRRRR